MYRNGQQKMDKPDPMLTFLAWREVITRVRQLMIGLETAWK